MQDEDGRPSAQNKMTSCLIDLYGERAQTWDEAFYLAAEETIILTVDNLVGLGKINTNPSLLCRQEEALEHELFFIAAMLNRHSIIPSFLE